MSDENRRRLRSFVFALLGFLAGYLLKHAYEDHLIVDQIRVNSQQQLLDAASRLQQAQQAK